MDGVRLPGHGKELPKDDGLSRSLGPGSDPQWIEVCHPTGGGVVTWARTAVLSFQLRSGHPRSCGLQVMSPVGVKTPEDCAIATGALTADANRRIRISRPAPRITTGDDRRIPVIAEIGLSSIAKAS